MRICHIITRLIVGGAQENTILTCEELHRRGHDVTLLAGPETGPEGSLWDRARAGGYAAIPVPTLRRAVRPLTDLRCLLRLVHLLRELRPHVVHTHSSKAGILGREAAARAGIPVIVHTIHGMSFNRTQPRWQQALFRSLEARAARRSHAVIGVARAMIDQALAAGIAHPDRAHVICSGMEIDRFDPATIDRHAVRTAWGFAPHDIVLGTVARLFDHKGYDDLLAVMPDLVRACPEARFLWVGDGARRADYERRLRDLGLHDRVRITGLVQPAEVPRLIAGMDALAHLSHWEGLPRAVVQARLMGVPVVAWNIDGTPEVVTHEVSGLLVAFRDLAALRTALVRMLTDANLRRRLADAPRDDLRERFDHRRMADTIEALYHDLLAARPHAGPAATPQ